MSKKSTEILEIMRQALQAIESKKLEDLGIVECDRTVYYQKFIQERLEVYDVAKVACRIDRTLIRDNRHDIHRQQPLLHLHKIAPSLWRPDLCFS